ncbi:MAG: hypothetical protein H7A41_05140 [Chlamydiales bacterium]|nr:hypothetical protein [Chlamydiales bacterium]
METLSRESSLLDYTSFTTKELEHEYYSILNPWKDVALIQDTDSGIEIVAKIALLIFTLTGSFWVSMIHDKFFHTISQSDGQALHSISSELECREEEKQLRARLQLDPKLVKKDFRQIDRKALNEKLKAPLNGDAIRASMLSTTITNSHSYQAAIEMLLVTQTDLPDESFWGVINVIKEELYSK